MTTRKVVVEPFTPFLVGELKPMAIQLLEINDSNHKVDPTFTVTAQTISVFKPTNLEDPILGPSICTLESITQGFRLVTHLDSGALDGDGKYALLFDWEEDGVDKLKHLVLFDVNDLSIPA